MTDRRQFVDWCYEGSHPSSDSKLVARALFLTTVQRLRPNIATDLFGRAFPAFIVFVADRFGIPTPSNLEPHLFAAFRRLPKSEFEDATKDWRCLMKSADAKVLRDRLRGWANESNLSAKWCLDHAVTCLRLAALDQYTPWSYLPPVPNHHPEGQHAWRRAIHELESEIHWSRTILKVNVYSDPLFGDRDEHALDSLDAFGFSWKPKTGGSCTKGFDLDHIGWDFFDSERDKYQRLIEAAFIKRISGRRGRGKGASRGAHTAFRQYLKEYFEKAEDIKAKLIDKHNLTKIPKGYNKGRTVEDHVDWLVRYQVPPLEKCADIKASGSLDLTCAAVRKQNEKTADFIGLKLRNQRAHAGRPRGSKTSHIGSAGHAQR